MAKYIVKGGQNLYDIALHLYGTVEGLFDLLISNPDINMQSELAAGMELEYHDTFIINPSIVNQFNDNDMIPINGERKVYFKRTDKPLRAIIKVAAELDLLMFSISGEGDMIVDWGDNSELETIPLTHTQHLVEHYFDNNVDVRRVRIYGEFEVMQLNATNMEGELYLTQPLTVDEFISQSNDNSLEGLFLFKGTYLVDLQRMLIKDLSPIYDMELSQLNLLGAKFQGLDVLDDYLENLVTNHQNRRACEVWLDTEPGDRGLKAIDTLLNDPEKNEPDKWIFHINEYTYTAP